jgi:hypothetical protein
MHVSLPYLNLRSSRLQGPVQPALLLLPGLQLAMWVSISTMVLSMQADLQAACMRVVRWICFHEVLGNRTVLTLTMMCSAAGPLYLFLSMTFQLIRPPPAFFSRQGEDS